MNNKVILAVVAITFAACITAKPRGPLHYNDKEYREWKIGQEHKRGALKQCMCKGEHLETHGHGSGTIFVGGCKEGWYNRRDQSGFLTACCKDKKKNENPTDEITAAPFDMIGAPGLG